MSLLPADQPKREKAEFASRGLRFVAMCRSRRGAVGAGALGLAAFLFCLLLSAVSWAQTEGELRVEPGSGAGRFQGRALDEVRVETLGKLWNEPVRVDSVKPGDIPTGALVRRALRELDRTGLFADLRAELGEEDGRLVLFFLVRPRRTIEKIRWSGGVLERADERRALGLGVESAITDRELKRAKADLEKLYSHAGYSNAQVTLTPESVDDRRRVLLRVGIRPGEPQEISQIRFRVSPSPHHPELPRAIDRFELEVGDRLGVEEIEEAKKSLLKSLRQERFFEAEVQHRIQTGGALEVWVQSGPRFSVRVEGNDVFGADELESELSLSEVRELKPELLEKKLRKFYVDRGYLDATVEVKRFADGRGLRSEIYIWVREGERFRIGKRLFPCLSGARSVGDITKEIDGVLSEQLPPAGFFGPVDPALVDRSTGTQSASPRRKPYVAEPWSTFSDQSYREVNQHLQDLLRADGYLDAQVGGATLVRRRCLPESPPGECLVEGPPPIPAVNCEEPGELKSSVEHTCVPDPKKGIRCEPVATLVLPILPGRQAILYDVVVEGNHAFSERDLLELAELSLGEPLRRAELEGALRRIQERYEEEAYAFAQIDSEVELSGDHTRARLVIGITERQRVHVSRIEIRNATDTSETLIRSRLALEEGELYRRSRVVRSQRQLESLGVFTSVTISLQDPGVPAREKVMVVTVAEQLPQVLETKFGFGTADGFRMYFEYGHRNLGGEAISLILRSRLSIRPPFLIAEREVREKYLELSDSQRLERRNTITLAFPEIGLGPLFRLEVELLDLLANERDFNHTRDAAAVRLLFTPRREFPLQLGATVELNDAEILGEVESYGQYVQLNNLDIRVPQGRSIAYTQNFSAGWDVRDRPLAATRGGHIFGGVEHVTAVPLGDSQGNCNEDSVEVFDQVCSELLKFTGKVSGYIPLSDDGLTFAMSLRGGVIEHLTGTSRTYPDRLFFLGGVNTMRGFTQYSLVPQDVADQILYPELDPDVDPNADIPPSLTIDDVVLRGGDIFVNPRLALRVPLNQTFQVAFFLDAGNLWADRSTFQPFKLRYAAGIGLGIDTPVGPLVFDYGFNIARLEDAFVGEDENSRPWEDIGAFHFSIGRF